MAKYAKITLKQVFTKSLGLFWNLKFLHMSHVDICDKYQVWYDWPTPRAFCRLFKHFMIAKIWKCCKLKIFQYIWKCCRLYSYLISKKICLAVVQVFQKEASWKGFLETNTRARGIFHTSVLSPQSSANSFISIFFFAGAMGL